MNQLIAQEILLYDIENIDGYIEEIMEDLENNPNHVFYIVDDGGEYKGVLTPINFDRSIYEEEVFRVTVGKDGIINLPIKFMNEQDWRIDDEIDITETYLADYKGDVKGLVLDNISKNKRAKHERDE